MENPPFRLETDEGDQMTTMPSLLLRGGQMTQSQESPHVGHRPSETPKSNHTKFTILLATNPVDEVFSSPVTCGPNYPQRGASWVTSPRSTAFEIRDDSPSLWRPSASNDYFHSFRASADSLCHVPDKRTLHGRPALRFPVTSVGVFKRCNRGWLFTKSPGPLVCCSRNPFATNLPSSPTMLHRSSPFLSVCEPQGPILLAHYSWPRRFTGPWPP